MDKENKTPNTNIKEQVKTEPAKKAEFQKGRSLATEKAKLNEVISTEGKKQPIFDKELNNKNVDIREKNINTRLNKPPEPPKMTKIPTPANVKNVQAMKGAVKAVGAVGKKLISPVAKIITVKEIYDYGKEFKEQIIDKPPVYEQLKEAAPENVPRPPKLEVPTDKENNFSNFSSENKQNFMMAMNEPETERPAFLEDLGMKKELPVFDMDVAEPSFDGEDGSDGGGE